MAEPAPINKRRGANLPHWTRDGANYALTFRLADSLPQAAVEKLRAEERQLDRQQARGYVPMSRDEERRLARLKSDKYQQLLDDGYGECVLQRDDLAEIVAKALKHFDGIRYRLWAWCVMPNHVHAAVQVFEPYTLASVLHSWKSFSAKEMNKVLGRTGVLWQAESYDHLIRDEADFQRCVRYILENPARAGFASWKWVGGVA